jgi:hypothetical protein
LRSFAVFGRLSYRSGREGVVMDAASEGLAVGTRVQVRNRFLQDYRPGFAIAEVTPAGYVVERLSDGARLPVAFVDDDVRED